MTLGMPSRVALALLGLLVFVLAWYRAPEVRLTDFRTVTSAPSAAAASAMAHHFASSSVADFVHSASITALPDGGLMAAWFAGSREGAADVQIRTARFDGHTGQWAPERVLATREATEEAVGKPVRKLGNPVIAYSPDRRLWLFYVSVSVGGWGGSAINVMHSDDLGSTWSQPRQLVTTPFFNLSTLVRSAPVFHEGGIIGLPIYHEFLGKFAEYLFLDAQGRVLDKARMGRGNDSLQPTIVPQSGKEAVALIRYAGEGQRRVMASRTVDAGRHWSAQVALEPSNPNSSLAAVGRPNGKILVALNDLDQGRYRLTLYETDARLENWNLLTQLDESPDPWGDPVSPRIFSARITAAWRAVDAQQLRELGPQFLADVQQHMCEEGQCRFEYEYPFLTRDAAGVYHLVYSWNDTFIKHVSFTDAWVEGKQ